MSHKRQIVTIDYGERTPGPGTLPSINEPSDTAEIMSGSDHTIIILMTNSITDSSEWCNEQAVQGTDQHDKDAPSLEPLLEVICEQSEADGS